jgi:LuxR family maltose regulon positive regulatory protein
LTQYDAQGFAAFELAAAANLRGYCALTAQEFESAREYLALARVYNEHVDAAFSRSYTIAVSGVALLIQGELREALERFKAGLGEHRVVIEKSFASAALFACYVWALYEANDLDTAEAVFVQNHATISESMRTDFLTVAYLSMARIHDARGCQAKADAILAEAEAIGHTSGWPRLVSTVKWERVRRSLNRGDLEQALATAASARIENRLPAGWIPFANDVEDQELGEIRLALARSDLADARVRIADALRLQRGRVLRKIKLQLLLAVLAARAGEEPAVRRELRTALRLAQAGGFVRCVLDEGPEVTRLICAEYQTLLAGGRGAGAASRELEFTELLLETAGIPLVRSAGRCCVPPQSLTGRERELLVLLANGTSNKDVANRLYVSENTVKFHLKNIYAKLAVTSRVRAITAAREIGIIQ